MRIALTGNPNSGKTTMYNAMTGKNEKVGNWAGVTVEKQEHAVKKRFCGSEKSVIAVDLPGAYSMSPFTSEESIASEYVKNEQPDVIINIVDSTNISRSLFFTTQLLELGIPVVVALNKADVTAKKETVIDVSALSARLGCPVVETVSTSARGIKAVLAAAESVSGKGQTAPYAAGDVDLSDREAVTASDRARFAFVNEIVTAVESRKVLTREHGVQDQVDAVLTNKWLGLPIFAVVMFLVFQISQAWLGAWIAEGLAISEDVVIPGLVTLIDWFGEWVSGLLAEANPLLVSIIVGGIIGGVGAVVGFLPLVMVMYFLIALLEDCGYMARATVVLDPIFKKVGLSGKAVIPFVVGTGCAVPGVMACRTIRNEGERRTAAMLTPFMPCGAKLPVIALFTGAFFRDTPWVGTLMYFVGILLILVGAWIINQLNGVKHKRSYFIIELPEYKAPSLARASISMLQRGWSYIVKAGTVILLCNFVVQLMQSFTWTFRPALEDASDSILASVSTPFAYLFAPLLGMVAWRFAAAIIAGFIAKENVVGTLAVCFVGLNQLIDEEFSMLEGSESAVALLLGITPVIALSYMMFNLFSPPCFAAIGAMNAEIKEKRWLFAGIGLQLGIGYTLAFLTAFFGTLFTGADPAANGIWIPILGWCLVAFFIGILIYKIVKKNREMRAEETTKKAAREPAGV